MLYSAALLRLTHFGASSQKKALESAPARGALSRHEGATPKGSKYVPDNDFKF
jgi:hypothetical protein